MNVKNKEIKWLYLSRLGLFVALFILLHVGFVVNAYPSPDMQSYPGMEQQAENLIVQMLNKIPPPWADVLAFATLAGWTIFKAIKNKTIKGKSK